jgi:hypothetical protein
MAFTGTAIEWIALVLAVLVLVKIIVILVSKKSWLPVTKKVYGSPGIWGFVFLILAAIVFWFLIQELSIVQIVAVGALISLLMGVGIMGYSKDVLPFIDKVLKKSFNGWTWLSIIIWIVLSLWVLWELFL